MMLLILWAAWLAINLITFILYGVDKRRARRGQWRIPERTLLTATWLLGGMGACAGMRVFRHKTKHLRFRLSAPLAAVVSLAVMAITTAQFSAMR
ncbi:MAG: DUF1294 domain-containing protein [Clostridia bacterium]|nr:DUF1294 domain-containing protein [Clostridia bacterium]